MERKLMISRSVSVFILICSMVTAGANAQFTTPSPAPSPAPSATSSATASPAPNATATSISDFARARIDTMFKTGHADPDWFAASFLSQVSASQIDTILGQIAGTLGSYIGIDGVKGIFTARFAKGTDEIDVHLDNANKIDALFFKPPSMKAVSLDAALQNLVALERMPGLLSYVVIEGRSQRAALNASAPLAVGSAFKLAVLAALRARIDAGSLHWTDVVPLDPRWKSLPSGVMQTWPDRTPTTIATYATQMISISDNTAADALAHIVGARALAPFAMRNAPFLTTREMFTLKSKPGATQRARFRATTSADIRRAILLKIDALDLPAIAEIETSPMLDIEWHYTVRDLCALIARVEDLPVFSINPGLAARADFAHVAYKGGSDFGVINLTTFVTTKRGTQICVSATLNDAEKSINDIAFQSAYSAVVASLANR